MTILKIVIPVFVLLLLGAFCYLTLTDVPIAQKQITKVIPNERFFGQPKPNRLFLAAVFTVLTLVASFAPVSSSMASAGHEEALNGDNSAAASNELQGNTDESTQNGPDDPSADTQTVDHETNEAAPANQNRHQASNKPENDSDVPGTLEQDFKQIEPIGLLSEGADGGLGEDVWVGSDRDTIIHLIPAAPRVTSFPEIQDLLRRLYLTEAKSDYFNKDGNRPEPGHDLLTVRIQKLESMGLYSEAIKLYSQIVDQPYHEKLARAGVLSMMEGGKGALGCLETRTVMDRFGQLEFWQTMDAICDLSLAKINSAAGGDVNDIDLSGSESKILDRLARNKNFAYRVSTPADIEILTPLERAALQINNAFVFEHYHSVVGQPVSPAAFGIMLGNRNLSESAKFSILTESASYGLKPVSDIQEQIDLYKNDTRDKPVGWRMLATLYANADNSDLGPAKTSSLSQAIDISQSYGGAYALAPFTDMLASEKPVNYKSAQIDDVIRAIIIDGKTVPASWLEAAASQVHDKNGLLLVIAAELNSDLSTESKLNVPALIDQFAHLKPREKALIAAVYEKLDKANELHNYTDKGAYENLSGLTASGDYVMPTSDLTDSLTQAYKEKKLGESILLSAIALQGVQPGSLNPGLLQEVVGGMKTVGLTKEARALASEVILSLSN